MLQNHTRACFWEIESRFAKVVRSKLVLVSHLTVNSVLFALFTEQFSHAFVFCYSFNDEVEKCHINLHTAVHQPCAVVPACTPPITPGICFCSNNFVSPYLKSHVMPAALSNPVIALSSTATFVALYLFSNYFLSLLSITFEAAFCSKGYSHSWKVPKLGCF